MANAATTQKEWLLVDAENEVIGRIASKIAMLVRGKHKPSFTSHVDTGDHVIVINAEKVRLTGNKMAEKEYQRYSMYPGGQTTETAGKLLARKPQALLEHAVRGMLPKTSLGRQQLTKLKVYAGPEHPHAAQSPQPFQITQVAQ